MAAETGLEPETSAVTGAVKALQQLNKTVRAERYSAMSTNDAWAKEETRLRLPEEPSRVRPTDWAGGSTAVDP